jgi:sialate O-acetylesterase
MPSPQRILLLCAAVLGMSNISIADSMCTSNAPVPHSLFSDNAVLQRDSVVPVWGTANEGETVTVEFNGQSVSATTVNGQWQVDLAPMPANATPQNMKISGARTRTIKNILVGDVWLASGQSNMERQLGLRPPQLPLDNWKSTVATANNPLIREFAVFQKLALEPRKEVDGEWSVCTPDNVIHFSAVGYFFIKAVYESQGIPLAIIHSSWGGTPAESWTSLEKLQALPSCEYAIEALNTAREVGGDPASIQRFIEQWYRDNDHGSSEDGPWHAHNLDTSDWQSVTVPHAFVDTLDGVVWYRRTFDLPESLLNGEAVLRLGHIDDINTVWINGSLLGTTVGYNIPRRYKIPAGVLKDGANSIAVRVLDNRGMGGWHATQPDDIRLDFKLESAQQSVALSGTWKSAIGHEMPGATTYPERELLSKYTPTAIYNAMIHPLTRFPIKGAIWYQGESNNWNADTYAEVFTGMIDDWRGRWAQGHLPFLFVQIAPYKDMRPELREAQRQTLLHTENTAMIVITDFGDADDIHPTNKAPVGERLALAARALAYDEDIVYSGPLLKNTRIEDARLILEFSHTEGGLIAVGGQPIGFEIAGQDGQFVSANARIDGGTVVLNHDTITHPTQARYGWSNVPDINLYNGNGLPASPFIVSADN